MAELSGDGPLTPRHPDLRPPPEDHNRPEVFAGRRDDPVDPERVVRERAEAAAGPPPLHPPGAPERLERQAIALERRAAWIMLLMLPIAVTGLAVNPFGLIGILMGLLANLSAIGLAWRNRTERAREAAGFAAMAYVAGAIVQVLTAPWVAVAFLPLGLAIRWLGRARALRREAWRIVWSARRTAHQAASRRRDALRDGQPHG